VPRKSKYADWTAERRRLDAELLARAEKIYKKLAAQAEEGDLKAMQLFLKELAEADGRAASRAPADADVEIISEVVPPNNKNKGRRPKKKS
jgi:regulator of protease activity HflC (stomatin/prohibitin superfamily)